MPTVVSAHSRSSIKLASVLNLTPAEGPPVLIQDLASKKRCTRANFITSPSPFPSFYS